MDISFAEPPVILRYQPNEYYHWHYDHIFPHNDAIQEQISQFGQRVKTGIYYLNDEFEGGETSFKIKDITIPPQKNKILVFNNVDEHGHRLKESIHRGNKVLKGEKWAMTLWFRDKPFWLRNGLLTK